MKYRNTKTGAVVDFKSKISGGYWQPLEVAEPPVLEVTEPKTAKKKKAVKKECNTQQ